MGSSGRAAEFEDDLAPYAGRWVARLTGKVVAQGGTPQQALQAAKAARYKEKPEVIYVPMTTSLGLSPLLESVKTALPDDAVVYLVGGAVRDLLLAKPVHDYDFAVRGDALRVARKVANALDAAYYPMDAARGIGRVVYTDEGSRRQILDFAALRGQTLEEDLASRDFTLNAMALDLRQPEALLDPMGGAADLHSKTLRACSSGAFGDDSVRVLRAIRMAAVYGMKILPETRQAMYAAVKEIEKVSPERLRDEIFNILTAPRLAASIQALDMLGVLPHILPELLRLKGVEQTPPHTQNAWQHTLDTAAQLARLLQVLGREHDPEASGNLVFGLAVMCLGRYRQQIAEYLATELVPERSLGALLYFAALYHDIGKPAAQRYETETGRIRFFEHDHIGAQITAQRGKALHFSNDEIQWLEMVVYHHMRPTLLANDPNSLSARAVYRFFRDTKTTGPAVVLLSLADLLATYGPTLPPERWQKQLDVARRLLEAWWEHRESRVSPPALINGNEIMRQFDLAPGPQIGDILEFVREGQAAGQVQTRDDAFEAAREYIDGLK